MGQEKLYSIDDLTNYIFVDMKNLNLNIKMNQQKHE